MQVDKGLIWNPKLLREFFEVVENSDIYSNRDLFLEAIRIRITSGS